MAETSLTFEEILADPENLRCKCLDESEGKPPCALRGLCKECIANHRYYKGVPNCLREFTTVQGTPPTPEERRTHEQIFADPENMKCTCTSGIGDNPACKYKESCKECIAIHRYYKGFPACVVEFTVEK